MRAPCDDCRFAARCAAEAIACGDYVAWSERGAWVESPRAPNRIDYLRSHADLNVRDKLRVIADVKREARRNGRLPTFADMQQALGLDAQATIELIERYKRKQGMTGGVVA